MSNVDPSVNSYQWIKLDKIRSGYLYFNDPVSKVRLAKKIGLNTIIVGCYRLEDTRYRQDTINKMKEWARAARNNGLHLFFAVNWQPLPQAGGHNYDVVVFDDGTKGIAVCPLDEKFWNKRLKDMFMLIAGMSIEPDLQVDGIFWDLEIYGSEKEPAMRRSYFESHSDYSDLSFFSYLINKGYNQYEVASNDAKNRKYWLVNNNLLEDYFIFLRQQIQQKAERLRETVHKINPNILIGMYPHPVKNNFVQYPLAKGFSLQRLPLIVFGVHSFGSNVDLHGDGYTRIPRDVVINYKKDGINVLYSAGYLLRKYKGEVLERNLNQSVKTWDGYWLFTLQWLWKIDDNFPLIDSAECIEKAIIHSNNVQY